MEKSHNESRGYWSNIIRIGRPICVYDARTKYLTNVKEFEQAMNDKKRTGNSLDKSIEIINDIVIIEE